MMATMGSEIYHRSDIIVDNESFKLLSILHESLVGIIIDT